MSGHATSDIYWPVCSSAFGYFTVFSGVIHERVYGRGSLLVKFKNHLGILIKFLKVLCSFKSKFFFIFSYSMHFRLKFWRQG